MVRVLGSWADYVNCFGYFDLAFPHKNPKPPRQEAITRQERFYATSTRFALKTLCKVDGLQIEPRLVDTPSLLSLSQML